MEKLKKFLINLIIIAYAVIAVSVTVLLLSYNDYHCSVLGGYTFVLVTDDELEDYGYAKGSLVLVEETKPKNINPGDGIFLYKVISPSEFEINYAEVILKDESKGQYDVSYVLEGGIVLEHEDVIGSAKKAKVIPHMGTILSILESRYGYLFLIVVVSFIAFLYEIYELIMEIKYGEREDDEEDYEEDDEEEYDDDEYEEDEEEEEVVVKPKKTTKKTTTTAKKTTSTKVATTKKVAPKTATKATTTKSTTVKKTTPKTTSTTAKKTTSTAKKASSSTTAKKTTTKSTATKKSTTAKKAESK